MLRPRRRKSSLREFSNRDSVEHFVFNGDGDGLCALQQLLLDGPPPASLVTGTKRDIDLVKDSRASAGDTVTVLDLSFSTNAPAVAKLLDAGVRVRYFDHHYAGEPTPHPLLELHIDTSPATCTSLIVNAHLAGRRRLWAAVGAWGDNLDASALAVLANDALPHETLDALRELGMCLNYNAYGDNENDLLIAPLELHRRLIGYADPLQFCRDDPLFGRLRARLSADMAEAEAAQTLAKSASAIVFLLPDAAWARRVSGLWAHAQVNRNPQRAHAVLSVRPGGGYVVSVRAPQSRPYGAAEFCRKFTGGGGREAAAGINHLSAERLKIFCAQFLEHFGNEM